MAKIKAGIAHTQAADSIPVHIENATERGNFEIHAAGHRLSADQARHLAELLTGAADKAEILDAAIAG